ncbi:MAG: AraC family transcriptional regulator [Clostridia bacterium]|nr:AraC family transcriptional regulator [Clostridia bacterium]
MTEILLVNRKFLDLNPLITGFEECKPSHAWAGVRNYTLIHYVVSGEGTFIKKGEQFKVTAGKAFIINPNEMVKYEASKDNPWVYRWIGFDGGLSGDFAKLPPVIEIPEEALGVFGYAEDDGIAPEYRIASDLFKLYAAIFEPKRSSRHYVRRIKDYINAMYMEEIRVEKIAEQMGLDRRYLSRLFKEKEGLGISEYIARQRVARAKEFLSDGHSVGETALLCGYSDSFTFSKMFKKQVGISPAEWKKVQK